MSSYIRFVLTAALLVGAGLFLHGRREVVASRQSLSSFPVRLGEWRGTDIAIGPDVREVLGPGDFLLRVYDNAVTQQPSVDLFVAYFPSQRAGDTIHSPKNCLPGAGWTPVSSDRINLSLAGRAPFLVNRYTIAKGSDRQLVLYWYWAHDRAVASEYWAKFYLVADSMRLNRSDGSLIRVTTPLLPQEPENKALERMLPFAGEVVSRLDDYIPR